MPKSQQLSEYRLKVATLILLLITAKRSRSWLCVWCHVHCCHPVAMRYLVYPERAFFNPSSPVPNAPFYPSNLVCPSITVLWPYPSRWYRRVLPNLTTHLCPRHSIALVRLSRRDLLEPVVAVSLHFKNLDNKTEVRIGKRQGEYWRDLAPKDLHKYQIIDHLPSRWQWNPSQSQYIQYYQSHK